MAEPITHDRISELKGIFSQTPLSIGLVRTDEVMGLIAKIEHLQEANRKLRIACLEVLDSLRNEDSAIEAQAEAEGKLGIYNPQFAYEIQILLAALREEDRPGKEEAN